MKTGISPMRMSTHTGKSCFHYMKWVCSVHFHFIDLFRSKILPVVEEGKSVFWGTILKAEERDWPFDVEVVDGDKVPLSVRIIMKINIKVLLKSNGPYLRPSKWSHIPVVVMKAAVKTWSCFALDTEHQYWTVVCDSAVSVQSKENINC